MPTMARGVAISQNLRNLIIKAFEQGFSTYKIGKNYNLPRTSVQNIIKKFKTYGTIENARKIGRPAIAKTSDCSVLKNMIEENPGQSVIALTLEWNSRIGKDVSVETCKRTIKKNGYSFYENKRRSRRVLSLKERIEVIRIAETRRDTRELALKFECGRTQILSILSQKERLLREWANNGDPNRLRRRPSAISYTINKVIYEWLNRCKCALLPVTETDILEKAYEAKQFFKYGEFRPNKRWLDRFKNKFRLNHEDLEKPHPSYYDGVERSLDLKTIYEEIKDTLEFGLPDDQMSSQQQSTDEIIGFENSINNYDQTMSSSNNENDVCEIADSDDEQSCTAENFCETQYFNEEPSTNLENKPISNDEQALECLKRLEEYSMLKDNFRAIGLIGQLEKIYKGQLES